MDKYDRITKILATIVIITGFSINYTVMTGPSPVLSFIGQEFDLFENNTALMLVVSVVYPVCAAVAMIAGMIMPKVGLKRMFQAALASFVLCGILMLFFTSYPGIIFCRVIYAIGFGIAVPFMGAATMNYYSPKQREAMDTVNGLVPWIGLMLAFVFSVPVMDAFGGSWRWSQTIWSIVAIPAFVIWIIVRKRGLKPYSEPGIPAAEEIQTAEHTNYIKLLKRREILSCVLIYVFDFSFYAYFSAVYPLFLQEGAGISEAEANNLVTISFPLVGLVGAIAGGVIASRFGRRKPVVMWGQMLKFVGIIMALLTLQSSVTLSLIGVGIFTIGNSAYLPAMYMVPMDLKGITPAEVGGSFSLIIALGTLVGGTFAPLLGGAITDVLLRGGSSYFAGIQTSIGIVNFANLIAFAVALFLLRETGATLQRKKTN